MTKNTACPNCGAEQANDGWARACYRCGITFDTVGLDESGRAALADLLADRPPDDAGRPPDDADVPAERAVPSSVRAARAALAAALHDAGRDAEAATVLAQALAEPGSNPPTAELRRLSALVHLAQGHWQDAQREALRWAASDAGRGPRVIDLLRDALGRASAQELIGWLTGEWLPGLQSAAVEVRVHGQVFAAVAHALLGHGTASTDLLRAAHEADPTSAGELWSRWLASTDVLSSVPGGGAYAVTLQARAAAALGRYEQARTLVDQVIAEQLTADGYPELEAYWLRAELPGRTPEERMTDLLAVAQRYRWRGTAADLRRAVDLCEQAMSRCPDSGTPYWHKAEALRVAASAEGATPDAAALSEALAAWESGRTLQPPTESWPLLVGSLVYRDIAQADPHAARSSDAASLQYAVRCVFAEPSSGSAWSIVAVQCRRFRLWPAARWAVAQTVRRITTWTPDNAFEAFNLFQAWVDTDPDGLQEYLPALLDAFAALPQIRQFVETATVFAVGPDSASARQALVDVLAPLSTPVARLAFETTMAALTGELGAAADLARAMEDAAAADAADALFNLRERTAALQQAGDDRWMELRRQLDDRRLAAAADGAEIDLHAAVRAGDEEAADRALALMSTGYNPGDILVNRLDFTALAERTAAAGNEQAAALARRCLAGFEALVPAWREGTAWEASAVLAHLDGRAWVDDLPEVRAAIAAVAVLVAEYDRDAELSAAADRISTSIALELSADLLPVDVGEHWSQWVLFRELVPAARARIAAQLGVPCSGIMVREFVGEQHAYRILLNGRAVAGGEITAPIAPHRVPVADWTDTAACDQALDALVACVVACPNDYVTPVMVRQLLEDAAGERATDAGVDPAAALAVWRELRGALGAGLPVPPGPQLLASFESASGPAAASAPASAMT